MGIHPFIIHINLGGVRKITTGKRSSYCAHDYITNKILKFENREGDPKLFLCAIDGC